MFTYCPPKKLEDLKSETLNNGRYYTTPTGEKLPSVTTVIGAMGKKAIYEWRQRVGAEEANRVSRIASGRGTRMHTLCEKYLNNEELGKPMPDALALFNTVKPLLNRINNIHYQECALWSIRLGMAGRVDCIGEFDGKLSVIDFKTSSRVKTKEDIPAYFAQCVAYALMYEELIGVKIHQIVVIMAVEGSNPILFVERTGDHVKTLKEYIDFYKKTGT
jgi:genome maintenance exonuclease 1